jgi:transposase
MLDVGLTWTTIIAVLATSSHTIQRWQKRFHDKGIDGIRNAPKPGRRSRFASLIVAVVIDWVKFKTPRDYGFVRSRWSCEAVAILVDERFHVKVGRETVRQWLHQNDLVYRRPRPVLALRDPQRSQKIRKIKALLAELPHDEVAFFQDEVDINTNPKIGSMWMVRGQQATVETPGNNTKRYLAGSQHTRTGKVTLTEGARRNAELFLRHLDDLRRQYRSYRVIHVICDNASFHKPDKCRKVREYLERWGHRIQLHYLPTYAPETNPIERVWWHLHNEVTRNHCCKTIAELLQEVLDWLDTDNRFPIETRLYKPKGK